MKSVSLKANKYGIILHLKENVAFDKLKEDAVSCFNGAAKMFQNEQIVLGFEGAALSEDQQNELVDHITSMCPVDICCILDLDTSTERRFERSLSDITKDEEISQPEPVAATFTEDIDLSKISKFYKGNVRSGMVLNEESSLCILGDVNPGAEVYSAGNIIILGSLKGRAYAGIHGNDNAFVFALNMNPIQIQIADKIGRCSDISDTAAKKDEHEPKIAIVSDDSIAILLYQRKVLDKIKL